MAKFLFEPNKTIKIGPNPTDVITTKNGCFVTDIYKDGVTTTNLFNNNNKAYTANLLNLQFKTTFFNPTNVQTVSTSFRIKQL